MEEEFEVRKIGSRHPTSHQARGRLNGVEKARRSTALPVQVNPALYFHQYPRVLTELVCGLESLTHTLPLAHWVKSRAH